MMLSEFAGITFQFENLGSGDYFDNWKWKLDAYRTSKSHTPPVYIQKNLHAALPKPQPLLQDKTIGFFHYQVFGTSDGGTCWQIAHSNTHEIYLQYLVSPDWSHVTLSTDNTATSGQMAFEYLNQIIPSVLLNHQTLTFHGVLMEHAGNGIILSAPSGTGKTTHARLWRDNEHALIINGDRAVCKKTDGIWTGFGLPWSGTSGEQMNRAVPLKAFVVLEQGKKNKAHYIDDAAAFYSMLSNTIYPVWDQTLSGTAFDLLADMIRHIRLIRLTCRPEPDAVTQLKQALEEI